MSISRHKIKKVFQSLIKCNIFKQLHTKYTASLAQSWTFWWLSGKFYQYPCSESIQWFMENLMPCLTPWGATPPAPLVASPPDIERARLSRGRMLWLLAHPFPPSPVSKLDRRHTGRLRNRDNLLSGEGGKGVGEDPNHTTATKHSPV